MNSIVHPRDIAGSSALIESKMSNVFDVFQTLDAARHLVKAGIMACDSIEDLDARNGFVALLAEVDVKVLDASSSLRAAHL